MKWKDDIETYWHIFSRPLNLQVLPSFVRPFPGFPCTEVKSAFLHGTLWWTPIFLTGLISCHISSPTTWSCQTLSFSMSPWVSLVPGYLMPSFLSTLAPTHHSSTQRMSTHFSWLFSLKIFSVNVFLSHSSSLTVELILCSAMWVFAHADLHHR